MLRRGQTIWDYDGWRLSMPAEPCPIGRQQRDRARSTYAVAHPLSTAALMAARVGVHFAHVRPFYSTAHNAAIVSWLVPVYALGASAGGACARTRWRWWCAAAIGTQTRWWR